MTSTELRQRLAEGTRGVTGETPKNETRRKVEKLFHELRRENQTLSTRLEEASHERDVARQEAQREKARVVDLQTQLESTRRQLDNLQTKLEITRRQLDNLQRQLAQLPTG